MLRPPSPGRISSGFGPRKSPGGIGSTMHQGLDYSWMRPDGVQDWDIYAAADGVVEFADYSGGWGNLTIINHGSGHRTYYAHQSRFIKHPGQRVKTGEVIGVIGNTGNSVGPHLHFELRIHGVPVDPTPYFTGTAADTITPIEEDDMPTYELVKAANSITVWFCVDRIHRYAIPSEQNLADYVHFIESKGQDATIKQVALRSFGTPVYTGGTVAADGAGRPLEVPSAPSVPSAAQIAAEVTKRLPVVEAGELDVAAVAAAVADELAARLTN